MAAAAPTAQTQTQAQSTAEVPNTATVDSMMEMLKKSR
jgi:hypothetical protein